MYPEAFQIHATIAFALAAMLRLVVTRRTYYAHWLDQCFREYFQTIISVEECYCCRGQSDRSRRNKKHPRRFGSVLQFVFQASWVIKIPRLCWR